MKKENKQNFISDYIVTFTVFLSYLSLGFNIYAYFSRLQFRQSEFLPIFLSCIINLLAFMFYKIFINYSNINNKSNNNKMKNYLYLFGFYGNFFFIALCIIIIIGFRIFP